MSKIFEPIESILIPASAPHPENTEYKISIGHERWGDVTSVRVLKMQMVYNGKTAGRRSPSYPSCEDYFSVHKAAEILLVKYAL